MFFRPEEVDLTSRMREVFGPVPDGNINIEENAIRVLVFDNAVTHFQAHGISAIQARRFDHDCFPRKKPADRQRFEASLREPFLMPID